MGEQNKETIKTDDRAETWEHIEKVRSLIGQVGRVLSLRALAHDASKLMSPEREVFAEVTPKLRGLTYGSDEYKAALVEMGEALKHHYAHNSHHPEHFPNGVEDMSLLDLVEMFADWKAASERHADGNFARSLEINRERFQISPQLASIFRNTARELGW